MHYNMEPIEIIIILSIATFFIILISNRLYKKINHMPTGECACCALNKKNRLLKEYHKKYPKK